MKLINTIGISKAYSEVYSFINALGDEYKNKIPNAVYNTIKVNRDRDYNPIIKKEQTIQKGMLSHEALALISALNLQYWCKDGKEKKRLKETYILNNEQEMEKYSYDKLFKRDRKDNKIEKKDNEIKNTMMVKYKNNIFNRFINFIKSVLKGKSKKQIGQIKCKNGTIK